ncbi:hypothetical protein F3Y22_tig00110321pilonHSYRG00026 [Hibiscus syriacus]|uniref:Uncharacterized protein n=1 Tax=Hibiscus syriacus TaxID=106335 RepID=A0A6A3B3W3_HIBSY|nr:hypothetical protein F3Y22_tig00110321pilonHSYRG00026 [Hibiscus syriacus]
MAMLGSIMAPPNGYDISDREFPSETTPTQANTTVKPEMVCIRINSDRLQVYLKNKIGVESTYTMAERLRLAAESWELVRRKVNVEIIFDFTVEQWNCCCCWFDRNWNYAVHSLLLKLKWIEVLEICKTDPFGRSKQIPLLI